MTKELPTKIESAGARTLKFTISTSMPDREHDRIFASGWRLDAYKANPVVLWAHDHRQPPIARAVDVRVIGDRLVASAEFVPKELSPFADSIFQLIKAGFLKGTSVGFRPLASSRNELGGRDITSAELLEFSICPIPANPQTLLDASKANAAAVAKWIKSAPPRRDVAIRIVDDPVRVRFDPATLASALAVTLRSTLDSPAFKAQVRSTVDARVAAAFRRLRGKLD